MKRILVFCMLTLPVFIFAHNTYKTDILGSDFLQTTLVMPDDYEGSVHITLIKKSPSQASSKAILYVHGYNDYFFQKDLANRFVDSGYHFYAIDLRKYGRSYLRHQYPFQVHHISEYFADLDSAITLMQSEGMHEIILMAHSTGGLISSLYCHENRTHLAVKGLILNSPFLDMNQSWFKENIAIPLVSFWGLFFKNTPIPESMNTAYAESLLKNYHGEWEFDTTRKYPSAPPLTSGWIRAIHRAHKSVQKGLQIPCPILVLFSSQSVYGKWHQGYQRGDGVLDVHDIQKYSLNLGSNVTQKEIPEGLHDLILSSPKVRENVYISMFAWIYAQKLDSFSSLPSHLVRPIPYIFASSIPYISVSSTPSISVNSISSN
ncbi:MAG: alpha/beta hydrolase [Bacteroidales bacterium]